MAEPLYEHRHLIVMNRPLAVEIAQEMATGHKAARRPAEDCLFDRSLPSYIRYLNFLGPDPLLLATMGSWEIRNLTKILRSTLGAWNSGKVLPLEFPLFAIRASGLDIYDQLDSPANR